VHTVHFAVTSAFFPPLTTDAIFNSLLGGTIFINEQENCRNIFNIFNTKYWIP
jgi:hypothetical protein